MPTSDLGCHKCRQLRISKQDPASMNGLPTEVTGTPDDSGQHCRLPGLRTFNASSTATLMFSSGRGTTTTRQDLGCFDYSIQSMSLIIGFTSYNGRCLDDHRRRNMGMPSLASAGLVVKRFRPSGHPISDTTSGSSRDGTVCTVAEEPYRMHDTPKSPQCSRSSAHQKRTGFDGAPLRPVAWMWCRCVPIISILGHAASTTPSRYYTVPQVDPVSSDSSSDAKSMVVFGVVICFCRLYHDGSSGEQLASRS
ncbi:uncharacterized protein B0T23DRAFT_399951 [Neurospora hispaniola]|uniref:Uncharacterized protein n=1 Tax=Neurospora hispaniola TaxID=588809 RepID=A0AAJ0MLX1_9PEZI|nr:hypothetical protein B0T23DRAFT_399951 [Neurospora hispaniola]